MFCHLGLQKSNAQNITLRPPNKGGFEVQLNTRFYPGTYSAFSETDKVKRSFRVGLTETFFSGQLGLSKNLAFQAHLPVVSKARNQSAAETHAQNGYANTKLGLSYAVLKPGLLDQQRWWSVGATLVLPIRLERVNPYGLATGYPAYALEPQTHVDLIRQKWTLEGVARMGLRVADYSHYLSAFGKYTYQFQSLHLSLTLDYLRSLENGTYITPPPQAETLLFNDNQSYLRPGIEVQYTFNQFNGLRIGISKTVAGAQTPDFWVWGLGYWVKWH